MSKFIKTAKGQRVRKELHIPPDTLKEYKLMAIAADTSPKEIMEDVLIAHIKDKKK